MHMVLIQEPRNVSRKVELPLLFQDTLLCDKHFFWPRNFDVIKLWEHFTLFWASCRFNDEMLFSLHAWQIEMKLFYRRKAWGIMFIVLAHNLWYTFLAYSSRTEKFKRFP